MSIKIDDFEYFKNLEKENEILLKNEPYIVLRLDGNNFKSFTKGMKKPFDERLHNCFKEASIKLFKSLTDSLLFYFASDEVSIVFKNNDNFTFNRKSSKLISIIASRFSTLFNLEYFKIREEENFGRKEFAVFDCRAFTLKSKEDLERYLKWRVKDTKRNSIFLTANKFFSHKELLNKTSKEKIEMMNKVKFNYEEEIEQKYREGTFLIKENKTFTITPEDNPYVKEEKDYTRKRVKVVENWESIKEVLEEADLVNLV